MTDEYDRLMKAYKQRDADVVRLTEERDAARAVIASWRVRVCDTHGRGDCACVAGVQVAPPKMYIDTVEAERDAAKHEAAAWYRQVGKDGQEIKRLREERDAAREERDAALARLHGHQATIQADTAIIAELRAALAEVEWVRCEGLRSYCNWCGETPEDEEGNGHDAGCKVAAALAGETQGEVGE